MLESIDVWFFVSIGVMLISGAVLWGTRRASVYFQEKSENDLRDRGIQGFDNVVTMAVREQNQAFKKDMKKARDPSSPGGTSITKEEARQLKKNAIDRVVAYFGMPGIMKVMAAFGATSTSKSTAEDFVGTAIEAKVDELKKTEG